MNKQSYQQQTRKVTLVGAITNLCLAAIKIVFGMMGHSHALVADGIHSISDLLTDALVLFASHFGSQVADKEHPYGHERIETAATVLLSLLLILTGIAIVYDGCLHFYSVSIIPPHPLVFLVALVSVIANEYLYHYTKSISKELDSELLFANAWHHRSDAASSVVVLLGLLGTQLLHFHHLDTIAAIIVGFMIMHMGWNLGWTNILQLIDTGVEAETLKKIAEAIRGVHGVLTMHQLRTRVMGKKILVDVHVLVKPFLSVSEAHHIGERVHLTLDKKFPNISDVTVHIDPEDDEICAPSLHLPAREELLPKLKTRWTGIDETESIHKINLHYLNGEIHIEVYLDTNIKSNRTELSKQLLEKIKDIPDIASLNVFSI